MTARRNNTAPRTAGNPPRLLDIAEVADWLGVNVRHVRRLVSEGRIPYIKWRRLLRFDPREIEQWLSEASVACRPDDGRQP